MKLSSSNSLPLSRWAGWLESISQQDTDLSQLPEYEQFLKAMHNLEKAHIATLNNPSALGSQSTRRSSPILFYLQPPVLLRVLDFLECRDLVRASRVCRRFYDLTHEAARIQTRTMDTSTPLQKVRLKEQLEGKASDASYRVVPIPFFLLERRVVITKCGDPECNGIYMCTDACGNGFIFTKPRTANSSLRCVLAKRFSGSNILWYLSKEEASGTPTYLYWAHLMRAETGPEEILQYPSQTSVLERIEQAWQALPTAPNVDAPFVEILDH